MRISNTWQTFLLSVAAATSMALGGKDANNAAAPAPENPPIAVGFLPDQANDTTDGVSRYQILLTHENMPKLICVFPPVADAVPKFYTVKKLSPHGEGLKLECSEIAPLEALHMMGSIGREVSQYLLDIFAHGYESGQIRIAKAREGTGQYSFDIKITPAAAKSAEKIAGEGFAPAMYVISNMRIDTPQGQKGIYESGVFNTLKPDQIIYCAATNSAIAPNLAGASRGFQTLCLAWDGVLAKAVPPAKTQESFYIIKLSEEQGDNLSINTEWSLVPIDLREAFARRIITFDKKAAERAKMQAQLGG